jgi:ribosomal-protein-serine acetyltransferase
VSESLPTGLPAIPLQLGDGLVARAASRADGAAFLALVRANVAHIGRYLSGPARVVTDAALAGHFDRLEARRAARELIEWHLFQDGALCGSLRLNFIDEAHRKASVAYLLDAGHQGRGIITRALRGVLAYAFGPLGFNRVELRCATGNHGSRRIAERLGFVHEGRLRQVEFIDGQPHDHDVFGLLAADFQSACDAR